MSISRQQGSGFGRKNAIINGNFDFWQRGTSTTVVTPGGSGTTYFADRWFLWRDNSDTSSQTVSRQSFTVGQTDVPNNPTYYANYNRTTTTPGTSWTGFSHRIEGVHTFADSKVIVSFWAKSASPVSGIRVSMDQRYAAGDVEPSPTGSLAIEFSTSWQKYEYGFELDPERAPATSKIKDALSFHFRVFSSLGSLQFDVAQLQIEQSSVATEFEYRHPGEELVLCQRYYEKSYFETEYPGMAGAMNTGMSYARSNGSSQTATAWPVHFNTTKRDVPTVTTYNEVDGQAGTGRNITGSVNFVTSLQSVNTKSFVWGGNDGTNGPLNNQFARIHWDADAEL